MKILTFITANPIKQRKSSSLLFSKKLMKLNRSQKKYIKNKDGHISEEEESEQDVIIISPHQPTPTLPATLIQRRSNHQAVLNI
jgi:hypothetical protein